MITRSADASHRDGIDSYNHSRLNAKQKEAIARITKHSSKKIHGLLGLEAQE